MTAPSHSLASSATIRQFFWYAVIGGVQYAVDLGVFSVLFFWSGYPIVSNLFSRACAAPLGYFLNGMLTFRVLGRQRGGFGGRYVTALILMTLVSTTLVQLVGLVPWISELPVRLVYAKAVLEVLLFVAGFLLSKLWIFSTDLSPSIQDHAINDLVVPGSATKHADQHDCGSLFILAHPDDEYFFAPVIADEVQAGRKVWCIYTTDGAGFGVDPARRMQETIQAIARIGVSRNQLMFVGIEAGIRDRHSHLQLEELYQATYRSISSLPIDKMFVLAWEGGHADHDASHLVCVALARSLGVSRVYECAAYTAHGARLLPFRVMHWVPRSAPLAILRFSLSDGLRYFALGLGYPSQRKTFLAMAPASLLLFIVRRRHEYRSVTGIDYANRPHNGPLLYEKRYGVRYEDFAAATAAFVSHRIGLPVQKA